MLICLKLPFHTHILLCGSGSDGVIHKSVVSIVVISKSVGSYLIQPIFKFESMHDAQPNRVKYRLRKPLSQAYCELNTSLQFA